MASHTITLGWTASTDAVQGYNVFEGTAAGNESATPVNGTTLIAGTTYSVTVSGPGVYSFVVKSVENGAVSVNSNEVIATVPPFPPTQLVVTAIS